ncbi:MAG: hypothetical protein N3G20_10445, partial [Verrucomicrobiae bacterium]|nr:hypothetical protein [Verrucomicrobiae bacterium]
LALLAQRNEPVGVCFYKPPNSEPDDNLFLMDYLGMMGLPLVPVASYPHTSRVVVLGAHATCDPQIRAHVARHLRSGATVVLTPSFLRRSGSWAQQLAGAMAAGRSGLGFFRGAERTNRSRTPVEIDASLVATTAKTLIEVSCDSAPVPLLTLKLHGPGQVLVLNIRTFDDTDYHTSGEWLLPPKPLGWPVVPVEILDTIRAITLRPLRMHVSAPPGVFVCVRGKTQLFYNTSDAPAAIMTAGKRIKVPPHRLEVHTP